MMYNDFKNGKGRYSGEDLTVYAEITRDKDTKSACFEYRGEDKWKIYAGSAEEEINFSRPVAEGVGPEKCAVPLPDASRYYFQLVTSRGEALLAERQLPMKGGFNFRDLGGYRTKDGRFVKRGKLFRSDDLQNLTKSDLDYLATIPLVSIVDFRSEKEMYKAPDKHPASLRRNYAYSINPGNLMGMVPPDDLKAEQLEEVMMEMNRLLVTEDAAIDKYRDFFHLLQNSSEQPLMFHCTAGKDRTGMGAALALTALGVDEQTVLEDYLLSNTYLKGKYSCYVKEKPQFEPLFIVKPAFLKAGFDRINDTYGSVKRFLTEMLNVDIEKMRSIYLHA